MVRLTACKAVADNPRGRPCRRASKPRGSGAESETPLDLRRQMAIVRRWLPLLVASALLAGGAAFLVSNLQAKVYEAKATLIVGQSLSALELDYNQLLVSQRLSATYAALATKRPQVEAVISRLRLDATADELQKHVRADAPLDSTLLTISAQDEDADRAAAIANALAEQLITVSSTIQGREVEFQASIDGNLATTQAQIESTQARVAALSRLSQRTLKQDAELELLQGRLVSLQSIYATLLGFASGNASSLLSVVEQAVAPLIPISPRPLINALVAALVGLLVVAGAISLAERLDDRIKDADGVQEVANLSTMGTIARMKGERGRSEMYRLAALLYPRSHVAEAYRALRTNIELASVDAPIKTLLVTSSMPGEGKTTTASNLAVVFAQAGHRVILVDADLRRPGVHAVFALPNMHGLTTMLRNTEVDVDVVAHLTEQANLRVLTTGSLPPNPAELLGSQRMGAVLERLKAASDLLVFDSPPLGAVTDAVILSSVVDGTLLVIDADRSRQRAVRLGREALARAGGNVLGVVLNRVPARAHSEYGGYFGEDSDAEVGAEKRSTGTVTSPGRSAP